MHDWERNRRLTLELVLEHLIQELHEPERSRFRSKIEKLVSAYKKVVEEADPNPVAVDVSFGLARRYGILDE